MLNMQAIVTSYTDCVTDIFSAIYVATKTVLVMPYSSSGG